MLPMVGSNQVSLNYVDAYGAAVGSADPSLNASALFSSAENRVGSTDPTAPISAARACVSCIVE
jgi:hypothetical protein